MLQAFQKYIQQHQFFKPKDTILLTVSGGIDSVVMCELCSRSEIKFAIAHCNFNLRGKESEGDELFVEALAESYGVPFHSITFETKEFAKKNKLSIQEAARKLRYDWFENISEQYNYSCIATAHQADDSIETFFINLIRGTGISGLHGILPKQGKVIRPLLFATKNEIIAFAKKNKLKHREDSSNSSDKYLRNSVRLNLIPLLKKLNPDIQNTLTKDIQHIREVEMIFKKEIEKKRKKLIREGKSGISISIKELRKLDPLSTYLFELLKPYSFNSATTEEIISSLDAESGKQFFSSSHILLKDRDQLQIKKKKEIVESNELKITQNTKSISFEDAKLSFKVQSYKSGLKINTAANTASFDLETLKFPLTLRKWEKGDSFQPIGMKGKKKLSDYFIDKKMSLFEKENVHVLLSNDQIIWVIGHRMDERFKLSDKTGKIYFAEVLFL